MPSCQMLPHGSYSLIPAVLTTMAWLASLFQDGCDYSRLSGPIVSEFTLTDPDVPWLEVGLRAYREPVLNTESGYYEVVYSGLCTGYPDDGTVQQDSYWLAAKAFDFFALVLGGGGTFFLWISTCCTFTKPTWRCAGYEVLLASICQSLSFLWFHTVMCQSEGNSCELFWGSKADIVSASLWLVAALSIFCYYPVPKTRGGGDGVWRDSDGRVRTRRTRVNTSNPSIEIMSASNFSASTTSAPTITTAAATLPRGNSGSSSSSSSRRGMSSGEDSRQDSGGVVDLKDVELA